MISRITTAELDHALSAARLLMAQRDKAFQEAKIKFGEAVAAAVLLWLYAIDCGGWDSNEDPWGTAAARLRRKTEYYDAHTF